MSLAWILVLRDYPPLEVGRDNIAPADYCHDPFAPIARRVFHYRRYPVGGRWPNHESTEAIEHLQPENDVSFPDKREVVGHAQDVAKNRRDWTSAGDTIRDCVDAADLDDRLCPP